ncbi:MAG: hypothetical protein R6X03_00515 [Methyloceanibacter sp.]
MLGEPHQRSAELIFEKLPISAAPAVGKVKLVLGKRLVVPSTTQDHNEGAQELSRDTDTMLGGNGTSAPIDTGGGFLRRMH